MAAIRTALLSVSDKSGLVPLATALADRGVTLLSTGGTARALRDAGLDVTDVADVTTFPEMLDGRVKTLHPAIHGGLLARRDRPAHMDALKAHGIAAIDLVVVNLYPFEQVAAQHADTETLIENIDIGGPSMLRSAAKNHASVTVLTSPADYAPFLDEFGPSGETSAAFRAAMAVRTFERTAAYDAYIAQTLRPRLADDQARTTLVQSAQDGRVLRYGENPHQAATVYTERGAGAIALAGTAPLQGKALSYNNLVDADAAIFALRCLTDGGPARPSAVVLKHNTPCGAGTGSTLAEAWTRALSGDPVSAFGGIVAVSHVVDAETAEAMRPVFLEVLLAPGFTEAARTVLAKKKNLRLIALENLVTGTMRAAQTRTIAGGLLVQESDAVTTAVTKGTVVTSRAPTDAEWAALDMAWRTVAAVKSNAITLAHADTLIGAGGGQTSRVEAVELAIGRARRHGHNLRGAALGSDAFFPFPDGVAAAAAAGITAIAQPGGSKRDAAVIAAADALGIAMVCTGTRHFRH